MSVLPLLFSLLLFPLFPSVIPARSGWYNKYIQLLLPVLLLLIGAISLLVHSFLVRKNLLYWADLLEHACTYFVCTGFVIFVFFTLSVYQDITLSTFVNMQESSFDLLKVIFLVISVLLMVIGNKLPTQQPGDTLGFVNKWTTQDREIWRKTHTLVGPLFVFSGIFCLAFCAFLSGWPLLVLCLVFLCIPIASGWIYSYRLWLQKTR